MEVYRYRTGVATDEQTFISEMDTFLTSYIGGWTRVETVSDTGTDRDYAWSSVGEDDRDTNPPGADPVVIRMRGNSNYVYQWAYGTYTSSVSNTFELYNVSQTRTQCPATEFRYWMWGNKSFVGYIIEYSPGSMMVGYLGLIDSFYVPETDPLPIINRAQSSTSLYLYGSNTYGAMHNVTTSGLQYYDNMDWNTGWLQNDVGNRNSSIIMLPSMLRVSSSATSPNYEVRGSFKGIYTASGKRFGNPSVITTASGVFIGGKMSSNDNYAFVVGPVASGIGAFPGLYINGTTGYSP